MSKQRWTWSDAAHVLAGVSVWALLALYTPPARPAFSVCAFHWLTGRPCPLCGMTRAFFALAKGHFAEAFHFNALSPLALVVVLTLLAGKQVRWLPILLVFGVYGVLRVL